MSKGDVVAGRDLKGYKRCKYKLLQPINANLWNVSFYRTKFNLIIKEERVSESQRAREREIICLFKCCGRHLYFVCKKK